MNVFRLKLSTAIFFLVNMQMAYTQTQPPPPLSQIIISTTPANGSATVQLTLPAETQINTLSAKLNGNEVGARFTRVNCAQGICEQATFVASDGLHDSKNVLSIIANRKDGSLVSARDRFAGSIAAPIAHAMAKGQPALRANDLSGLPTLNSFLPPAIAFNTPSGGGYRGSAWIQIGSQNTYPANPSSYSCSGIYTVIILDRQTLQEKTAAPESSPNCVSDGVSLQKYLLTLNGSDLVIVGSNYEHNSDAASGHGQLNTSAIGGTAYNCLSANDCSTLPSTTMTSSDVPQGYMAIGVGGAASGSAYENYYTLGDTWVVQDPQATGMLVEDASGNYNFQPAATSEYTIVPNDPNNSGVSTVTVGTIPGDGYGVGTKTYRPPVGVGQNGMWMLKLQRSTLFSIPFDVPPPPPNVIFGDACPALTGTPNGVLIFNGCGQFYDTGDSNSATAAAAYNSLMADLEDVDPTDLVFLVGIGNQPGYANANGLTLIPSNLAFAFSSIGGTPETLTNLSKPGSTYSYVGCANCGNSLGGHVVISTNLQAQQGQNGYIHGLLQPNLNGLYWPTQASLDQPGSDGLATSDYTIQEVTSTQPVEWPELSDAQKLSATTNSITYTSDSTAGQNAAYYYISYQLITQHYISGAQGNYVDDIHYYFTGGNNNFLDYHIYDPSNLVFPGSTPTPCYSWTTDPVPGRGTLCFTQNDFNAVRAQMHNEMIYLTNVLQFMVNGSTNMKDIVASGSGSAALALINAAASVEGSTLQPPPATPVKSNISNILNLVGNVVSVVAAIGTDGATAFVGEDAAKAISYLGPVASGITGIFGIASSATAGVSSGGGPAPIPGRDATFLTTIGSLSSNTLQQSFTAGFDTGLDTILGDWYKLSTIGPKITDTNQPAFQAPTQVSQFLGAYQIGQASQRNFYMALLPIGYSVQHYTYWWGQSGAPNYPDMGARTGDYPGYCNTWYFDEPAPPTINLVSKSYLSYSDEGPTKFAFWYNDDQEVPNPAPIDWFVLASSASPASAGSSSQRIQLLDAQVASTLFNSSQLNIPMDAFLDQGGPMASVWWDSSTVGFDHFSANQTCSFYVAGKYGDVDYSSGSVGTAGPGPNAVQVTMHVPPTGVLGDNVALKATAVAAGAAVTSGTVSFQDGSTSLGQASLDGTGTATLTVNTLALGLHAISASFLATSQYTASNPITASLTIYANDPTLTLTPSAASLAVSSGSTSSPLSLQVTSKWGLAGTVVFTCSGLPAGTSCNFTPSQVTLTDGSSATTTLTVASTKHTAKLLSLPYVFFATILPLPFLFLRRKRFLIQFFCMIAISATLGVLSGCTGGASPSGSQPTASTVLVTATSGNFSRSTPINLTVQ